ncbi:uncharacterized protein Mb2910c-like [Oculina patagonica]
MKPNEFAKRLGVSVKTLQRWDDSGKLPAKRTPANHRYYTEDDLLVAKGLQAQPRKRLTIVYCRVSSQKQSNELANQRKAMEQFCLAKGIEVDHWIEEIGGGLNFKRREFLKALRQAMTGEVETIIVAHKDRLARFAFDLIEELLAPQGCKLIVANQPSLSPQQELVEDLMAIIHCFSCRLYGSRSYANKKTREIAENLDTPIQGVLLFNKNIQC